MSQQPDPAPDVDPCCPPLTEPALSGVWADDLASMVKPLADPVRLRLVSVVASHEGGEACVCDLTPAFDLSPPTISHHLSVLREAGLLERERRGTWVFCRVVPAAMAQLAAVLAPADPPPPGIRAVLEAVQVDGISLPIAIGLLVMTYPVLAKVRYDRMASVTSDEPLLVPSRVLDRVVGPALMLALAWLFLPTCPSTAPA